MDEGQESKVSVHTRKRERQEKRAYVEGSKIANQEAMKLQRTWATE